MSVRETTLLATARACTICGHQGVHHHHFIADHIHDGTRSTRISYAVEMDHICGCGHCCSCFLWEKEKYMANIEDRSPMFDLRCDQYYQSICQACVTGMSLQKDTTYEYCVVCVYSTMCPRCLQRTLTLSATHFSDYQHVTVTCECGQRFQPRNADLQHSFPKQPLEHDESAVGPVDSFN